jgi:DNA-binding protein HU-beta
MNKSDLIDAMATQAEVSKAAAGRALDAAISARRFNLLSARLN